MKTFVLATVSALALAGSAALARQAAAPAPMPASPRGTAATQVGGKWVAEKPGDTPRYRDGKWIVVDYGRPILRGRTDIFGAGAEYGRKVNDGAPVWRAGANQTTRLKTEVPLVFAGKTLPAGEYSLFVDLKPSAWTLVFSSQPFQVKYDASNKTETWGAANYDPKFDVLRVPMQTTDTSVSFDQFTIVFVDMTDRGGAIGMWWEKTAAKAVFTVGQ